jgi:hypothetical protein
MQLAQPPIVVFGSFSVFKTLDDEGNPDGKCAVVGPDGTIAIYSMADVDDAIYLAEVLDELSKNSLENAIAKYPRFEIALRKQKSAEEALVKTKHTDEERMFLKKELDSNFYEDIERAIKLWIEDINSQNQQNDENDRMKY